MKYMLTTAVNGSIIPKVQLILAELGHWLVVQ